MNSEYTETIDLALLKHLAAQDKYHEAFDMLVEPLHVWLYQQQDFDALASRTPLEQLILAFDYVQSQVGQGGFIQLIQNGYVSLLLTVIESLEALHWLPELATLLDKALQIYMLNQEALDKQTTVEEFGRLYAEFREFELIEVDFGHLSDELQRTIVNAIC